MLINFLKGIVAGAFIAFPVGPIGIICLRRMLAQGALMGLASGLGCASADIIYSTIALLGLSVIYTFLVEHTILIRVISSIFLCAFGVKIIFSGPSRPVATWTRDIAQAYFSTFFLTLSNPLIIFSFITCFAVLGIHYDPEQIGSLVTTSAGVFLGSSLWWFAIGAVTEFFGLAISPESLLRINKFSGISIVLFGILTMVTILFG